MKTFEFTVHEKRVCVYTVEAENESAARQAFIDGDCIADSDELLESDTVFIIEVEK